MFILIRRAVEADLPRLADIYADAVRTTGPTGYSPEQVAAWATTADDFPDFRRRLLSGDTFVAEADGELAGFADLAAEGYVSAVFVRGDRQRRGIGGRLLRALLEEAERQGLQRLHTRASLFSQGLFEQHGFVVVEMETVEHRGVTFNRAVMERVAARSPG